MEFFEGVIDLLKKNQKYIFINSKHIGIHAFRDRERVPEQVSYIYYPHRHVFHFSVIISVNDIISPDYIILKRFLDNFLNMLLNKNTAKSCEMMGREIIKYFRTLFPASDIYVFVSEDNENGSLVWEVL